MKHTFKILDVGNFYFPLRDMGKKFIVEDTITFSLEMPKDMITFGKKHPQMVLDLLYSEYPRMLWNEIKKDKKFLKKYKNYWLCPCHISSFKENIDFHVDILKPVKGGTHGKNKKDC